MHSNSNLAAAKTGRAERSPQETRLTSKLAAMLPSAKVGILLMLLSMLCAKMLVLAALRLTSQISSVPVFFRV